tara:strand:+ start:5567 stop:5800 length:234 start_codon:yes stop_codon:yes gene_type:complete
MYLKKLWSLSEEKYLVFHGMKYRKIVVGITEPTCRIVARKLLYSKKDVLVTKEFLYKTKKSVCYSKTAPLYLFQRIS